MSFVYPADVEGYPNEDEARALYELACLVPENGVIVELGSYKGRSAIAMAQSGHRVTCVDRFEPEELEFLPLKDHRSGNFGPSDIEANAQRYGVQVSVYQSDTATMGRMWDVLGWRPVNLLFIDADHSYEGVKADADAWLPLVAPDGVVVFDDSYWPGVAQLLGELDDWTPIPGPQVGGLTAMKRIRVESEAVHA